MASILDSVRRLADIDRRAQIPAVVVGAGHGANHWITATLYVLLPFIVADLGMTYTETGSLVTLLYVTIFITNVGSGPLVDLSGRYVIFQAIALAFGGVALVALSAADSIVWLAGLIVLMGIATSMWHPAALTFLARSYPGARGFALSLHNLGASLGDMLAPLVAGLLLAALTWQGAALVSSVPLFAMMALILFSLSEPGAADGAPSGRPSRAGYLQSLGLLVRNRALLQLFLMAGVRSMTQNGLLVFIPLYLVGVIKASPTVVGGAVMVMQIGGMIAGPLAGAWSDRVGRRTVALAGLGASTVLISLITLIDSMVPFVILIGILGFCVFAVRPVVHSWTMDLATDAASGSAVSLLFMAQSAFAAMVPVAGGVIADIWGLATVFYIITCTCLIAATIAFFMPDARRDAAGEPA